MARLPKKDPLELPQTGDTWIFGVRKLRTWIAPEDKDPVRPFIMIAYNRTQGLIQGSSMVKKSSFREAQKALISAMTHSPKGLGMQPCRPARIIFDDRDLHEFLRPVLQEIGVKTTFIPHVEPMDELVRDLETHLHGDQPEISGLLSGKKVTTKFVAALFEAAAFFYREAPWIQLSNDDPLAIRIHPSMEWNYATVMGQAGVEYGLALYKDWADLERMYLAHDHPMDIVPDEGSHSLLFNKITEIPFDDVENIERYGWVVPDPQAYPFPVIFIPPDRVERPDADEILWYEATLRAIPEFVKIHLKKNLEGEIQPIERSISVATAAGTKSVEIKFPAGELPLDQMSADDFLGEGDLDSDDESIPFDLRMMEGQIAHLLEQAEISNMDSKAKKAQDIMYKAWGEQNPAKRLSLAHKALRESEDCADAYVLLAEEEAASLKQALVYYEKGVAAGQRALGREFFTENVGYFWGLLESRPYMRALAGKASCLWQLKRREESLRIYWEMIRLNPDDNQGIRYILVDLLLQMNREAEVEKLLRKYKGDGAATWLYTQALTAFRKNGPSSTAARKLNEALEENPYVPDFVVGKKRIPNQRPESINWGGESEAVDYAANHLNYWRSTPGAIEWLQSRWKEGSIPEKRITKKGKKSSIKN